MQTDDFVLDLSGPLEGPVPMSVGDIDLEALGYVEEEYVCSGVATAYDGEPTEDGRWTATPGSTAPFTTRFVVKRPASAEAFNGTVVVEWLNVSGGGDGAPDWMYLHREITRAGTAWVGVSAQKVGIDGGGSLGAGGSHLKGTAPERYGILEHPGDAYSFDMYTQVGRVVRGDTGRSVLGDLVPERILAIGESQSAAFLVTYVNGVDPLAQVFDGFLIHGRGGRGADLTNVGFFGAGDAESMERRRAERRALPGQRIRHDVRVPVLTMQSETDVVTMAGSKARQDDGERTRLWEIAGASHADVYLLTCRSDDGTRTGQELAELFAPTTELLGMTIEEPINTGTQQHYIGQSALAHLDAWVRDGTAPPSAPRLELTADGNGIVLDDDGLARGGIRTPWVDAPLNRLTGLGSTGPGLSMLFGITEVWDPERLAQRYPGGRDQYLQEMRASLTAAVDAGFLLEADAAEIDGLLTAAHDLVDATASS